MADRFCEPGLYGNAVVTANITSGNATLTVTAVTSGRLGLGARVIGTGIPLNTFITALGTGRGGAGTYTMSNNASATQTGVTVTAEQGTPALDPEWGVAQEGDGLAKGAATPATAHIVFTGTPSGTISVCGVSLSPTWGSGADAAANGLATAINAATGTVTTSSYNSGVQLRNAVWARGPSGGAPAGTCQIMTRVGSALHNGLVCIAHNLTNVNAGASSLNFSGGASGAWGMLFNGRTSCWPSGISKAGYGLWCGTQPFVGSQVGHTVHIRADVPVLNTDEACEVQPPNTINTYTLNRIDDGTHWPNSLNARLQIDTYSGGGNGFYINFRNTLDFHITGSARPSDGAYTLFVRELGSMAGGLGVLAGRRGSLRFSEWRCLTNTASAPNVMTVGAGSGQGDVFVVSDTILASPSVSAHFINTFNETYQTGVRLEQIVFDNTGAIAPHQGIVALATFNGGETYLRDSRFVNFVAGSRLFTGSTTSANAAMRLFMENINFGNVSNRGPFMLAARYENYMCVSSHFTQYGARDFFIDNPRGFVEWNSALSQPTLNALLPDGTTKWSIRLVPSTTAGAVTYLSPLTAPRIAKINSLQTGQRTITVEFCASDELTWTKADVSLRIVYQDANGAPVVLDTYDQGAAALDTSSATWSQESGGKVTFSAGGTVYLNKYKLSVTTPAGKDLPEGAEIGAFFNVHRTVNNTTQMLFVDPDIGVY